MVRSLWAMSVDRWNPAWLTRIAGKFRITESLHALLERG
jgi:hypothetical protein